MKENVVVEKSKAFAVRIIQLYKYMYENKKEFVMAECAFSKKDVLAKMYIAFKECSETKYWLELLYKTEYLSKDQYNSIDSDCTELLKLLSSITKSTKYR